MRIEDLKVNHKVIDRWWPEWGVGTVTRVLKTVVYIDFAVRGSEKYDKNHIQFLDRATKEVRRNAAASLR